jgi:anion transporter
MNKFVSQLKDNSRSIKWLASILVISLPLLLPVSAQMKAYMMITLWAITMWMFELVYEAVVGILIPVLYILFNVCEPSVAFAGWLSSTPWITIGGLMVGSVFVSSGLVKRIAYKMLIITGGSLIGIVIGITITSIILTPIIPSVMAKVALMTPLVIGFCQVLGLEKKDKTASALMLVVFLALWSPKMAFVTASADSVMTAGILAKHYAYTLSWMGWAKDMFIPALLWTLISVSLVFVLKPEKIHLEKSYLMDQYNNLGPMTEREKKTIIMAVTLILLLATDSWHNIEATWIMVVIGTLSFFPGIGLSRTEDFNKLNFSIVFYLVGAVAIGNVTASLGVTQDIVRVITPIFAEQSSLFLIMSIYVFSMFATLLLNPLALIATLMGPVADICGSLGYPSILGGYAMIMGFNQAIFPYQVGPLMLLYGFGYLKLSNLMKVMAVRIAVGLIFTALVTYPYWKLMGLVQ